MNKLLAIAFGATAFLAASTLPAAADCKSDLVALKARLAREKEPSVIRATQKHVRRAEIETRGSESECRNAVTRGWRAIAEAREALALEAKAAAEKRAR
jgi:hypothetical protein